MLNMLKRALNFIKRVVLIIWLVCVAIVGGWIAFYNNVPLSLNVLGLQLPESTAGIYMCCILVLGVILGFTTHYVLIQGKLFARKRALSQANKEVAKLRTAQLTETP